MSSSIHQDHGAPTYALADKEGQHHLMVNHLNVVVFRLVAMDLSFDLVPGGSAAIERAAKGARE